MKKYLFILSIFATLATTACDTSSKASTTQTLAPTTPAVATTPEPPLQTANQPTVVSDSAMLMRKKSQFKKASVDMMRESPATLKKTDN